VLIAPVAFHGYAKATEEGIGSNEGAINDQVCNCCGYWGWNDAGRFGASFSDFIRLIGHSKPSDRRRREGLALPSVERRLGMRRQGLGIPSLASLASLTLAISIF
jgi:hypothetical protein